MGIIKLKFVTKVETNMMNIGGSIRRNGCLMKNSRRLMKKSLGKPVEAFYQK